MKYLSPIVFVALLIWSWNLVHSLSGIAYETHFSIQERMAEVIQMVIKQKRPEATNLKITRLWTETLDDQKVKLIFEYNYSETATDGEVSERSISGEAILIKTEETEQREVWTIEKVQPNHDELVFMEGLTIKSDEALNENDSLQQAHPAEGAAKDQNSAGEPVNAAPTEQVPVEPSPADSKSQSGEK
jgi:hypothetical protein